MTSRRFKVNGGKGWIEVEKDSSGSYRVVANSMTDYFTELGFIGQAGPVEVLDPSADGYGCFGISEMVKVGEVILTPAIITAPNLDAIARALQMVEVVAWCSGDI
jgi:hypothetical protein